MNRAMWFAVFTVVAVCSSLPLSAGNLIRDLMLRSALGTTTPATPTIPPPPPVDDVATFARYIVHYTDWTALGHISHQIKTNKSPSSRVFSMADGPIDNSTGTPYIYTSYHDSVPRDLKKDTRCSMTMSLAETDFCMSRNLDPEDPRCAQVILTGHFVIIPNNTEEWKFAENALFSRHPEMRWWPKTHHFFFAKLSIDVIQIVDNIGGSKYPSLADYYNSPPPMVHQKKNAKSTTSRFQLFKDAEVNLIE